MQNLIDLNIKTLDFSCQHSYRIQSQSSFLERKEIKREVKTLGWQQKTFCFVQDPNDVEEGKDDKNTIKGGN